MFSWAQHAALSFYHEKFSIDRSSIGRIVDLSKISSLATGAQRWDTAASYNADTSSFSLKDKKKGRHGTTSH